jgi:hypothetical protein
MRSTANKKKKPPATRKINWQKQIQRVVDFCEQKQNFSVEFEKIKDAKSFVDLDDKVIQINTGHTPEIQLYTLLHEVGHVLIHNKGQKAYRENVGFAQCEFSEKSMTKKIGETEEEYEAWKLGYLQAKKLGLKVDRHKYERLKATWISTYLMWSVERKIRQKILEDRNKKIKRKTRKVIYD